MSTPVLNVAFLGTVNAMAQTADAIYVGGDFTQAVKATDLNASNGAVINSVNADFIAGLSFDGQVWCSAIHGDSIYFGGSFTSCKGIARQRIVKINLLTKEIDTAFDSASGFDNVVQSIAFDSSGNVYVGGQFATYKGTNRQYFAKLNGSTAALDTTFDSAGGFNNIVTSIIPDSSGNVYVGGSFTSYKGTTRQYIAKLNSSTAALDTTFDSASGFSSTVNSIALDASGNIYAAGQFVTYKGTDRQRIAKLNSSTAALDTTFDSASGFNSSVLSIALDASGNVYVGGGFWTYKGTDTQYIAKLNGSTAALDTTFNSASGFNGQVNSITLDASGNIYAGGAFSFYKLPAISVQRIAKISKATGLLDTTFDSASGFSNTVNSIALDSSGNVYVGGSFITYKGTARERFAKLNGSTAALDTTFDSASGFNNVIRSIALDSSGNVYVGGSFTSYKGTTRQYIAKLNSSTAALDTTFDSASGFNSQVNSIALDASGNIYAAGQFATYKGTTRQYIAKLNSSTAALDTTFDSASGFNNSVLSIALDASGNVYAAGSFTSYKGTNRQRIAKLNGSTAALDTTFDSASGFDSQVQSIALDASGNIYAGGWFTSYKGTARQYISLLNGSTAAILLLPSITNVSVIGSLIVGVVGFDPRTSPVLYNNLPLPEGSVVRNSTTGQKFYKLAGAATNFQAIPIIADVAWEWSESGELAWTVLQDK